MDDNILLLLVLIPNVVRSVADTCTGRTYHHHRQRAAATAAAAAADTVRVLEEELRTATPTGRSHCRRRLAPAANTVRVLE